MGAALFLAKFLLRRYSGLLQSWLQFTGERAVEMSTEEVAEHLFWDGGKEFNIYALV
jgi:hypothetical protein